MSFFFFPNVLLEPVLTLFCVSIDDPTHLLQLIDKLSFQSGLIARCHLRRLLPLSSHLLSEFSLALSFSILSLQLVFEGKRLELCIDLIFIDHIIKVGSDLISLLGDFIGHRNELLVAE